MKEEIVKVSRDFWNIRGSFRVGGVIDIRTQASLVRLGSGNFVFLDSYSLSDSVRRRIADFVGPDAEIEAILNLHPFHTVHVANMHELYPRATLYGTSRHVQRFPELPWAAQLTEEKALHKLYADDFAFSVPRGVDFISSNQNIHFSSVLALHHESATIHVDDTLMYIKLPMLMRLLGVKDRLGFHPTLSRALQRRAGAVAEFRDWANSVIDDWREAQNLCAAHTAPLLGRANSGAPICDRLQQALHKCDARLCAHEKRYG